MASIINNNGLRMIQFFGDDRKRRSLRLGQCDARTANEIKIHIERIIVARQSSTTLSGDTANWLNDIDDDFYERVVRVGLCEPRVNKSGDATPLAEMLDAYIARRTDLKPWSVTMLKQGRDKLVNFFGADKPIGKITPAHADDFKRHYLGLFSKAYVAKLVMLSRQFFRDAVRREQLKASPFADIKPGSQKNKERQKFISRDIIDRAIDSEDDLEWKLVIALARYGGLRVPSETTLLRFDEIFWDKNYMIVHSPKTEHHDGGDKRDVPLFPEIRGLLRRAFEEYGQDGGLVFRHHSGSTMNLRTQFLRILKRAGIEPWPKLFQNLRSTRQTELAEKFPAHVVCAWMGNSMEVAEGHYLQVLDQHIQKAAAPEAGVSDGSAPLQTVSATLNPNMESAAESGAADVSTTSQDEAPQNLVGIITS
jgi:integrase